MAALTLICQSRVRSTIGSEHAKRATEQERRLWIAATFAVLPWLLAVIEIIGF